MNLLDCIKIQCSPSDLAVQNICVAVALLELFIVMNCVAKRAEFFMVSNQTKKCSIHTEQTHKSIHMKALVTATPHLNRIDSFVGVNYIKIVEESVLRSS